MTIAENSYAVTTKKSHLNWIQENCKNYYPIAQERIITES